MNFISQKSLGPTGLIHTFFYKNTIKNFKPEIFLNLMPILIDFPLTLPLKYMLKVFLLRRGFI